MKVSRLHCVCRMDVRRSRSRYRSQRISLLCVRRLFNPLSAGRLQQRQAASRERQAAVTALCPGCGSDPGRLFCPGNVPVPAALEWFRLHFTCECCCFLNYGDRNTATATAIATATVAASVSALLASPAPACGLALLLRCFLPGILAGDHSRKCCVSTWYGRRSRILFKMLPRNRIFDASMSGPHKNAMITVNARFDAGYTHS